MQDFDWFKAFCLMALGLIFGPLIAVALWILITQINWPIGEGAIAATMVAYFGLPVAFFLGLI